VTHATNSLPLGPDLLKLGSQHHTSTISFETAPVIPQEFEISSPTSEFGKAVGKVIRDLEILEAKLGGPRSEQFIQIRE